MTNAVNVAAQTVAANSPVLFASNRFQTGGCLCCAASSHEPGTGIVNLRQPGIYYVTFNGNIATTAAGEAILNIQANGVDITGAQATVTTAADTNYAVSLSTLVQVCCNDTVAVSVENGSTIPVTVTDANIIVTRLPKGA